MNAWVIILNVTQYSCAIFSGVYRPCGLAFCVCQVIRIIDSFKILLLIFRINYQQAVHHSRVCFAPVISRLTNVNVTLLNHLLVVRSVLKP